MNTRFLTVLGPFLLLLMHIAIHNTVASRVAVKCIERERRALLAIREELIDDHGQLSSWDNAENQNECCRWEGVYCSNHTGHVVELKLGGKRLKGTISPSLVELYHLNHLDLSRTNFNFAPIPKFIGSLTQLTYLNLSHAVLWGEIPLEIMNLSGLRYLDLSSNFINGTIPSHLGNLSQLLYLDLSSPLLSSNLEWLAQLPSLTSLVLQNVNLSSAKNWLQLVSNLFQLTLLDLNDCHLPDVGSFPTIHNVSSTLSIIDLSKSNLTSSIFPWLLNYNSSLTILILSENSLSGPIPHALGNFGSLEQLELGSNNFEGGIPQSLWDICSLSKLSLYDNKLSVEIDELIPKFPKCAKKSLQYLSLRSNNITGAMPDFSEFLSLKELHLNQNHLNGTLSDRIGQLSNLEALNVGYNSLRGVISEAQFSNLSFLTALDLSYNALVFNVSANWVPPFQLKYISLASCKLGPYFPKWLRTQTGFYTLDISSAEISDVVPEWFWGLSPYLQNLNLSHNQLRGQIADLSPPYSDKPGIDLSSNMFDGQVPAFLSLTSRLDLSNNKFSDGSSLFCATSGVYITFLDLSNNRLRGELPDCWENLPSLSLLDLTNNKLSGNLPASMGSLVGIRALHLANNKFTGEIPWSLSNCAELRILDVVGNDLSGVIPSWIGEKLVKLVVLSLRSNSFYGSLPSSLCHLAELQVLDLSLNAISGRIPKCLQNLTALTRQGNLNATISYFLLEQFHYTSSINEYIDSASIIWKGKEADYKSTLGLVRSIDLSSNDLVGEIPSEIMNLVGLISLNISRNNLTGEIPSGIGQLSLIDFLDLSRNHLSGKIPSQFAKLDRLGVLDLSYNNLSGKIPLGTQLQSFEVTAYAGNLDLCGDPLPRMCPDTDQKERNNEDDDEWSFSRSFYLSMAIGFILGIWGVCGSLVLFRSWRYAYFTFWSNVWDKLYVFTAIKMRNWKESSGD